MKLSLGTNIASVRAQRRLAEANEELGGVYTRLSSGMRINDASDDAAGLAISESINTDRRVFSQAVRNLNDGISLLSIADGAVSQLTNITVRLQELAQQAINGSLGDSQREAIDLEAQELSDEYFRIARSTEFNGLNLFDGSLGDLHLQAGYGTDGGVTSSLGGAVGDGTFREAADLNIPSNTNYGREIQLADLDGDGNMDMVGAGRDGPVGTFMFFVQMGNGDGTFDDETVYDMANATTNVLLGDINNDGNLDAVTVNSSLADEDVSYRLGNGDGTFEAETIIALSMAPGRQAYGVELGDFNNDGNLDIITGDDVGNIFILSGDGSGGFVESSPVPSVQGTVNPQFGTGDVNGDGIDDFVVTYESAGGDTGIDTYFSNGDGTFVWNQTTTVGTPGFTTLTAPPRLVDFNNDGALDLITGDGTDYDIHILMNDGQGTFGAANSLGGLNAAYQTGDFNGDGNQDIAAVNITDIAIYLGNGDGGFRVNDNLSYNFSQLGIGTGPGVADINNDGVSDMVVADGNGGGAGGLINVYIGNAVSGISPIEDFDLSTQAGARQALPIFQKTLDNLTLQRGEIGAFQSRVGSATSVLEQTTENLASAESRIRDADVAEEAANLVRLSILQQGAASILSSANQQYEVALSLISG